MSGAEDGDMTKTSPRHLRGCIAALMAALMAVGWCIRAPEATAQNNAGDTIHVTAHQMRQLSVAKGGLHAVRIEKAALGPIAFNADTSTAVRPPFPGRVTRLIAKIGEAVKRGAPLLEIDSSDVVQPQSDLIAAVTAMNKARSQLGLAEISEQRDRNLFEGRAGPLKT